MLFAVRALTISILVTALSSNVAAIGDDEDDHSEGEQVDDDGPESAFVDHSDSVADVLDLGTGPVGTEKSVHLTPFTPRGQWLSRP